METGIIKSEVKIVNILFLSLLDFSSFDERNIYSDLLYAFIVNGHRVFCVSPVEKRRNRGTELLRFGDNCILKLKIGNIQKVNLIEKGISTLRIEPSVIRAIKRYCSDVRFDLVLYATPPVTFARVIRFVKKRDGAKSYLMLKDIFPQNSVDLGMLSASGVKGLIYRYFRRKEKALYAISDRIGCMSGANVDYVLQHNPEISPEKVEICPNSIEVTDDRLNAEQKTEIRRKYGIPADKTVLIYGGNLGKPQGIPFIIECLKANAGYPDRFFVICGAGTEYPRLKDYIDTERPEHVLLINGLPKKDYEDLAGCCDIGLIFLDHRFTIPNFPSRLLSYMQRGMPVLACTDPNTDIGKVIIAGGFGWWCESDSPAHFTETVCLALAADIPKMGGRACRYLKENYSVQKSYETIVASMEQYRIS